MNRRWICNDVWMDILPCFDHAQLGLKLALLSPRFNALVDKHFEGKSELTIWRQIVIHRKDNGRKPKLFVLSDDGFVPFPLPNRPLPSKIRFKHLRIEYIDHSVIAFLRSNQQIFDKRSTNLHLWIPSSHDMDELQLIWDVLAREIWPFFSTNIHRLGIYDRDHLDYLFRVTSPTRLHSPRKDGQPKRFRCGNTLNAQAHLDWVNSFKEHFHRANAISSVSYEIHFSVHSTSMPMIPFELVNEWTKEKLTLAKAKENDLDRYKRWIMKRCKIIGEAAAVQQQKKDENWDDNNCNNVFIWFFAGTNSIGQLSPPPEEKEAGQSITKGASSADK